MESLNSANVNMEKYKVSEAQVKKLIEVIENDKDLITYNTRYTTTTSRDEYISGVRYDTTKVLANTEKNKKKAKRRNKEKKGLEYYKTEYMIY